MDLEHHFTVDAPVDTVWTTMMDLEKVAECFPGATLTEADGDSFTGTVKVKLGPIAMLYKGSGSFTDKDESAHRAVIEAKGRDKRGNGTAGADVVMTMTSEGSGTRVDVRTDLNVTGKPAQFGRGVMQDVSDKLLAQFTECLAGRFDGSGGEEGATSAGAGASTAGAGSGSGGTTGSGATNGTATSGAGGPTGDSGDSDDSGVPAAAGTTAAPAVAAAAPASPGAASPPRPETPSASTAEGGAAGSATGSSGASTGSGASSGSTSGARTAGAGSGSDDAIDLGGMLVPGVVRTYLPHALVGLLGLVLGLRFGWKLGHWFGRHSKAARKAGKSGKGGTPAKRGRSTKA